MGLQLPRQLCQAVGVRVAVVAPRDQHVLEGQPPLERLRCAHHVGQLVLPLDWHQRQPRLGIGRVQGDRQAELLRPPGQPLHGGKDADG